MTTLPLVADISVHAAEAARFLKSIAHGARLMVLCQLADGEKSVGELQASSGLSQSAFSQHLAKLREEKVVSTRREGTTIHYRIANADALTLVKALEAIYCRPKGRGKR